MSKTKTPAELCPLCSGDVTEVRCYAHFSYYDGGGGSLWQGRCACCDAVLKCRFASDESPVWRADIPAPEQLLAPVQADELPMIMARFVELQFFERPWQEFLKLLRPGDEVWRINHADVREAFAIVRQGRPLAEFLGPNAEFEQKIREYIARQSGTTISVATNE